MVFLVISTLSVVPNTLNQLRVNICKECGKLSNGSVVHVKKLDINCTCIHILVDSKAGFLCYIYIV